MTSPEFSPSQVIIYPARTQERAARAMRCAPFRLQLFAAMDKQGVELRAIAGESGVKHRYTRYLLSELAAESSLLWLIQVGILRREVDGQGITDCFRLTPLGHQLTEKWQQQGSSWATPQWLDRWRNALAQWLRLPF